MSLFQAREWWTAKPDEKQECDAGCLWVGNIDNATPAQDKIVTGSFQGILRIFLPRQSGYLFHDLMLEKDMNAPILQLAGGRFLPRKEAQKFGLAILHPKKLSVYVVKFGKMAREGVEAYYDLILAYEHKLDRSAYNLCFGPFGGVQDRDFLCVQSLDGQLSFYEQDIFAFSRYLKNDFLIPGPICYVQKIDAFVTVNSGMQVQCYTYRMFGASSAAVENDKSDTMFHGFTSKKKVSVEWSLNLGEHVIDLFVAKYNASLDAGEIDIFVLGEHTIFTLNENGAIRIQKRLDYEPTCCLTYEVETEDTINNKSEPQENLIVGTNQKSLLVYRDTKLVWAARSNYVPVALALGTFAGIKGMVVSINDQCHVQISYMGTDLLIERVATLDGGKELNYEAMDEEHRQLQKVIKKASSATLEGPHDKLLIASNVPNELHQETDDIIWQDMEDCARDENGKLICVLVTFTLSNTSPEPTNIQDVNIAFSMNPACLVETKSIFIPSITVGETQQPYVLSIPFCISRRIAPSSLDVNMIVYYLNHKNEQRIAHCDIELPLCLAARVVLPQKNVQYLFVLETNKPAVPLPELFPVELRTASKKITEIKKNVMTLLCYANNIDITVIVSKKTGRYRLQSGTFTALTLLCSQLAKALHRKFPAKENNPDTNLKIFFKEQLPLADYFNIIDEHHACRMKIMNKEKELENAACQYRVIQKRLLVRYKDKNPAPLGQLDTIFTQTYDKIISLGEEVELMQKELVLAGRSLSSATELILLLMKFKYLLDEPNYNLIKWYLSPLVCDSGKLGWEEYVDTALVYLFHTSSRSTKSGYTKENINVTTPIDVLKDTYKLKRHLTILIERLANGHQFLQKSRDRDSNRDFYKRKGSSKSRKQVSNWGGRPQKPQKRDNSNQ